jgi:hypothetical protein
MNKKLAFLVNKLKELRLSILLGPKLTVFQKRKILVEISKLKNQIDTKLSKHDNSNQISSNVKILKSK